MSIRPLLLADGRDDAIDVVELRYVSLERSHPRPFTCGLDADGVVKRVDYGEIPPRVDYSLTKFGRTLASALSPLCQWGSDHAREVARRPARAGVA
jgi:hypothetical protein